MLDHPRGYRPDKVEGRLVIGVAYRRRTWEVVVEPDTERRHLVVVTAYECEREHLPRWQTVARVVDCDGVLGGIERPLAVKRKPKRT